MAKRLSRNTIILLISNIGSAILSFLLAILIGRYYGEAGLGTYASILAWIFPLSFIVEFGFGTLITRDIAQDPDLAHEYLRVTWQFRLIVGSILVAILCLLSPVISDSALGLIISSPLVIVLPAYGAYTAIFRAHQRMLPIAWLNLGMLLIQVMLTGIVIWLKFNLLWLFIINTITSSGQCLAARWVYQTRFYQKPKAAHKLKLGDLIRQARPFAIAGILAAVQARYSVLWLETVSTPIVVGLFVASLRFIDGARIIPNALFGAVYPALAALSDNRHALNRLFIRVMIGLGGYSLIVALFLSQFADEVLLLTFGEQFIGAQPALQIMGLALIPFVLRSTWSLYWYAIGCEKAVNILLVLNLIILIITSYLAHNAEVYALYGIVVAILYTEIITLVFSIIGEVILWKTSNTSSTD